MWPEFDRNWSVLNTLFVVVFNKDTEIVMLWSSIHFFLTWLEPPSLLMNINLDILLPLDK